MLVVRRVMPFLVLVTVGSEQKRHVQRETDSKNWLWRRWGRPWSLAECEL